LADTSNFDEEFTREKPTLTPVHGQLTVRDQAEFNGFSWVSSNYRFENIIVMFILQVAAWADHPA